MILKHTLILNKLKVLSGHCSHELPKFEASRAMAMATSTTFPLCLSLLRRDGLSEENESKEQKLLLRR